MTVSTHVYRAFIIGTPDIELSVRGGRINFDAGVTPHVTADIDIAVPDEATLDALDPRMDARVRVEVEAEFPSATQTREFDLGLRDRNVSHADGTVSLVLASDEALLSDYAPLADDDTPFDYQSSLRDVVNYVLGEAIPGAALESTPANDADATTYGSVTNLIPDPSAEGPETIFTGVFCTLDLNDTSWAAHGSRSINLYNPISTDAWLAFGVEGGVFQNGLRPGGTYIFSATGRVKVALSGAENARARRLVVLYLSSEGGYEEIVSDPIPTTVGVATRVSFVFTIPQTATEAFVRAYHGHEVGQIQWDAYRLSEYTGDPSDTDYFDGGTTDTDGYLYAWTGDANDSTSSRTALIDRDPESLIWKAGQNGLDFLAPLVQVAGFRLVCDEQRNWTLRAEDYVAAGSLSIRHAVNLIDGTDAIARDSGLWFDAAVTTHTWTDRNGNPQMRSDAYALSIPYTRLRTFEKNTAYPGPGFSEYAVRRAQGRGREVSATAVADWTANAEQAITIVLENAPTQIGATQSVEYNLNDDEMTVTTRTTDTPEGAIDLLTGNIDALTGTIDSL